MLLHTIIDLQEIFSHHQPQQYFYKKVENCMLEGVQYKDDIVVQRIISTNPKDYLNPQYSLGQPLAHVSGDDSMVQQSTDVDSCVF